MKLKKILQQVFICSAILTLGCSSIPEVKKQAYAELSNERTFEYDFPVVWKNLLESLRKYKLEVKDPSEATPTELRHTQKGKVETDWIYGKSRDKYQIYQINGSPRTHYLQTRFKYTVNLKAVMGGVKVKVHTQEEIEKLKEDGSSAGFSESDSVDSSRGSELLDKLNLTILSAAP